MRRSTIALALLVAVSACGQRAALQPAAGTALPVAPFAARTTPTPDDLLTPSTQARPARSDDLLQRSQPRPDDRFDLPPG